MTRTSHRFQFLAGVFVLCLSLTQPTAAVVTGPYFQKDNPAGFNAAATAEHGQLVAQVELKKNNKDEYHPKSGTLLMPSDSTKKDDKEGKKCMNVCTRWGQDCIIDPARGRKCRRTCQEFGEECF